MTARICCSYSCGSRILVDYSSIGQVTWIYLETGLCDIQNKWREILSVLRNGREIERTLPFKNYINF